MINISIQFDETNGDVNIGSNLKPGLQGAAILNLVLDFAKNANIDAMKSEEVPGQKPKIVIPQMAIDLLRKKKQ